MWPQFVFYDKKKGLSHIVILKNHLFQKQNVPATLCTKLKNIEVNSFLEYMFAENYYNLKSRI